MTYELIVTEKPSQAKRIAESLADSTPTKKNEKGVTYYELTHNKKEIRIVSAVGHVYSLTEKKKTYEYPSYDIHWVPAYEVNKQSDYTKKYVDVIKKLAKKATTFTVATDFDVEGEVIGLNVIRFACNKDDANRMKFSTLTKPDLVESYNKKQKHLEWGQAKAGETRHFLDWMYGINISRALSTAIKKAGLYKLMSAGRVQGPSLKLIVDKEKEIRKFVPTPYWEITYNGQVKAEGKQHDINAQHEKGKFTDKKEADTAFKAVNKHDGTIKNIEARQINAKPPTPFDLTTLQTESFKSLKLKPKDTLAVAQELYTAGYISYPRTSSQQLPEEIGYTKIFQGLQRQTLYKALAEDFLALKVLKPNNGKKQDPAHPAIYPTGIAPDPKKMSPREIKVYDIIVRRFMATFAQGAIRETNKLIIDVNGENVIAKGTRTVKEGWYKYYGPHVTLEEEIMPKVSEGDKVIFKQAEQHDKMTQPPKRFTQASLIKELEKRNLGTKATRASIIETLFDRDYVTEKTMEPTEIGMKTISILEKYCPEIVKEELTRTFEEEMDLIREGKSTEKKILDTAKKELDKILGSVKEKEAKVGKDLKEAIFETQQIENTIGECPICKKGTLTFKFSPKTKQKFIGCDQYPDCKAVFGLPGSGRDAKKTNKVCEHCNYPMVSVGKGRGQRVVCFNMECPVKVKEEKEDLKDPKTQAALKEPCKLCGGELLLRKSVYGEFIGCSTYPKCRYTASADGTPNRKTLLLIKQKNGELTEEEEAKLAGTKKKTTKKKKTSKKTTKKAAKKVTKKKTTKK